MFNLNKLSGNIIQTLKNKVVKTFTNFFSSKINNILDDNNSKKFYFDNKEYLLENGGVYFNDNGILKLLEFNDFKGKKITNISDIQILEGNSLSSFALKTSNGKSYVFNKNISELKEINNSNFEYINDINDKINSTMSFGKFNLYFGDRFYYIYDYDTNKSKKFNLKDEYGNEIVSKNIVKQDNNIFIIGNNNEIFKFRYGETGLKKVDSNEYLNFINSDNELKNLFEIDGQITTFQDKKTSEFYKESTDKKILIGKGYLNEAKNNHRIDTFYLTKSSNFGELDNIDVEFHNDNEIAPLLNLTFKSGIRLKITFGTKSEYLLFFNLLKSEFHFEFKNNLDPISKINSLKQDNWKVFKYKFGGIINTNTFKKIDTLEFTDNLIEKVDNSVDNLKENKIIGYTYTTKDKLLDKLEKLGINKQLNIERIDKNNEYIKTNEKNLLSFLKSYGQHLKPYVYSEIKPKGFILELLTKKEELEKSIKRLKYINNHLSENNQEIDKEIIIYTNNLQNLEKKDKYFVLKNELKTLSESIITYKKKVSLSSMPSDKILRSIKLQELEQDYNLKSLLFDDLIYTDSSYNKYEKETNLLEGKLILLEQELINLQSNKIDTKGEEVDIDNSLSLTKQQFTNTKQYNGAEYYFEVNYKNCANTDFPARLKVHYKYKGTNEFLHSRDYIVLNYDHSEKVYKWLEKITKIVIDIKNIKVKLKDQK